MLTKKVDITLSCREWTRTGNDIKMIELMVSKAKIESGPLAFTGLFGAEDQ